jgi:hypothetical protein
MLGKSYILRVSSVELWNYTFGQHDSNRSNRDYRDTFGMMKVAEVTYMPTRTSF